LFQDELLFQIECLNLEVKRLKQEKMDLEILLDTTAEHAELVELEFQREITDYQEAEKTLQQANRELENLSYVDALTQVANRRQFEEYLEQKWEEAQHENNPLSLIMADVDYFKRYNDEYGHQAGDYCLIRVAQAISKAVVDSDDLVARYGGEEFAIILSNASAERVVKVAESIRTEIQKLGIPHRQSFVSHNITLSLGIASLLPSRLDSLKSLIALADKALYQAKDQGRDRFSMLCH
jgi:diguanylate cyclase (GGDEF)-like protein